MMVMWRNVQEKIRFFKQINALIDWNDVEKEIRKVYKCRHSVGGCPAYN
jgi:hypothetical protein